MLNTEKLSMAKSSDEGEKTRDLQVKNLQGSKCQNGIRSQILGMGIHILLPLPYIFI